MFGETWTPGLLSASPHPRVPSGFCAYLCWPRRTAGLRVRAETRCWFCGFPPWVPKLVKSSQPSCPDTPQRLALHVVNVPEHRSQKTEGHPKELHCGWSCTAPVSLKVSFHEACGQVATDTPWHPHLLIPLGCLLQTCGLLPYRHHSSLC